MQLFLVIKKIINFSSLSFFIFFISCAVHAQDVSNPTQSNILDNKKTDSQIVIESQTNSQAKASKSNQIRKNKVKKITKKYVVKNPIKIKKIKNKKNVRKVQKKRIIKKLYVIKKKPEDQKIEVKESLDQVKRGELENFEKVAGDYLIEIEPKEDCDKMVEGQCLRGDKFFQEPYFHYTLITIFNYKIVAEQFFENYKKDKDFLKVKDGEYIVYTKKGNKLFIVVKNGIVDELVLLEGDLNLELKITSKCQYSDKLFAFHNLYETNEIARHNFHYGNDKNFRGLVETNVFVEKYQPKILYSVYNLPNKEVRPTQDLNLCKIGNNIQVIERDFTKTECNRKFVCTMKTLAGYGSEGFMVKDRNFSFFDFFENNKIITLDSLQIQGLLDEVAKLSREDKADLKTRCFNDKNVDLISCSASEKCDDYLNVQACDINYFFDKNKLEVK